MQAEVPERVWTSLEEGLVPTTNVVMQTWMDRPARGAHKDTPVPTNTCCVDGEPIHTYARLLKRGRRFARKRR